MYQAARRGSMNRQTAMKGIASSMLIMITSFIICSELYTLLYSEIIREFSTFAGVQHLY